MGIFSLSSLPGFRRLQSDASRTGQTKKDKRSMKDFSHLNGGARADTTPAAPVNQKEDIRTARPDQHTRSHNVAVSEEARNNPVLAVRLLKDTDLSSRKIRARLASSAPALSAFTQKFMEENDPTWEFQDDEEKALTALTYATQNRDANGYNAAFGRATQALAKMVEPMTEDERQAVMMQATKIVNDTNPDSPDNIRAREQADQAYNEAVAKAAAVRNDRHRATGVVLSGDARRVNGKAVSPDNEADSIRARLEAGLSAGDISQR